ncbi:cytochrome-c peroxidase [bacterium]|nr:cytochrome-c peroxidase [bacterium]
MNRYGSPRALLALMPMLWVGACSPDPEASVARQAAFRLPVHFPAPVYDFKGNQPTEARVALGRKLFFEPELSRDGTVSCADCHRQYGGFSDPYHDLSHGVDNLLGTRNSPALSNLAWYPHFMWDGGAIHIETMSIAPITNPVEMDETLWRVVHKLNHRPDYRAAVQAAYGEDTLTDQRMLQALAQFMAVLISDQSPYDRYLNGKTEALTVDQQAGLALFRRDCASCHAEPLTTDFSFKRNGLAGPVNDEGRQLISLKPEDKGRFKVPNLRNVALSPPYMHNGRLSDLSQVIDHYSETIGPEADAPLSVGGFHYTPEEKNQLLEFLNALTDEAFVENPLFANPD